MVMQKEKCGMVRLALGVKLGFEGTTQFDDIPLGADSAMAALQQLFAPVH